MKNDRPPTCKFSKWLMGNNKSSLPGLMLVLCVCVRNHCYILTLLLGVVKVLWEGEAVGDLQCFPNHQPHKEPCHQLRTATFLLTVFDNLQRNLVPSVGGREGGREAEREEERQRWREAEREGERQRWRDGRDGGRQGWRGAGMEGGRDGGRQR